METPFALREGPQDADDLIDDVPDVFDAADRDEDLSDDADPGLNPHTRGIR
jgi:hypothetical protein